MAELQIRQLNWRWVRMSKEHGKMPSGRGRTSYDSSALGLEYEIFEIPDGETWTWRLRGFGFGGECASAVEAKAEAQSDFERRISSYVQ